MSVNNQAGPPGKPFAKTMWTVVGLTVPMLALINSPILWHISGLDGPSFELISAPWLGLMGFNGLSLLAFPMIYLWGLALYILRLRSLLGRVPEKDRALPANAVWLVIAVPFNFVGSFFVISGTSRSLALDGTISSADVQRWRYLGTTWCGFQVLSFAPIMSISVAAALLSYILWAAHWLYSVTLDEQLAAAEEASR